MLVPWREKNRWHCQQCGLCCEHFTVSLREEKLYELAQNFGKQVVTKDQGEWKLRKVEGACIFQNQNGLCQIHERKPTSCTLFPFYIFSEPRHNLRGSKAEYWMDDTCYYVYVNEFCRGFGKGESLEHYIPKKIRVWKTRDVSYPQWRWSSTPSSEQKV